MDRVGRGSVYVEHCCISMLGAITPARLRTYLIDTLEDGPTNDGLLQRFQLLVYPDAPKDWRYVNRAPNEDAITKAQQMYERLIALDVEQPLYYCFDDAAQQLFVEWLSELQHKLRDVGIHTALVSHLAKYRKLMPALALLFELADDGSKTTVSFAHARQAAAFCEYLESHARRIYSMVVSPERAAAAELGRHLLNGWKRTEGMFTVRDVYQNDWSGLNTPEKVRPALEILLDAGWIRLLKTGNRTGRPSQIYAINPRLHERTK
jgi:putative DNA primase/helicase